jgi:hypothetical protein
MFPACRVSGAPAASYDCVALDSVIARVCIVRIPRHLGGKRAKEPAEEDPVSQFVLNDLVGPPPADILPVVKEELWERIDAGPAFGGNQTSRSQGTQSWEC